MTPRHFRMWHGCAGFFVEFQAYICSAGATLWLAFKYTGKTSTAQSLLFSAPRASEIKQIQDHLPTFLIYYSLQAQGSYNLIGACKFFCLGQEPDELKGREVGKPNKEPTYGTIILQLPQMTISRYDDLQ